MKRLKRWFIGLLLFLTVGGAVGVRQLTVAPPPPDARPLVVTALLPTTVPTLVVGPTATAPVVRTVKPAAPVATAVKVDPVIQVIVTAEPGLNVRAKPGGAVVGSLRTGAVLSVKSGGDWAEVVAGEYRGKFVAAKYLRVK